MGKEKKKKPHPRGDVSKYKYHFYNPSIPPKEVIFSFLIATSVMSDFCLLVMFAALR